MKSILLLGIMLAGCGAASSSEEAKAADALAPKPPTAEQQAQMDKIKAQFPQPGAQPGRS